MEFAGIQHQDGIAVVTLARGKVNALDAQSVAELREAFRTIARDDEIHGAVLTGAGKFFSFGFDIPQFLSWPKERFREFLLEFTQLYAEIFLCSKPVIAALNGHAIAGGCMLAIACDRRVMSSGNAKISLNEITFGSAIFAGSMEMLRLLVGTRHASEIMYSGHMYPAAEARGIGLVDEVAAEGEVLVESMRVARILAAAPQPAFGSLKHLLRAPIAEEIGRRESKSIDAFLEIWYSPATWKRLQEIQIR